MKPRPQAFRNRAQLSKFMWRNQDTARAAPGDATGLAGAGGDIYEAGLTAVRCVHSFLGATLAERAGDNTASPAIGQLRLARPGGWAGARQLGAKSQRVCKYSGQSRNGVGTLARKGARILKDGEK